jgi:hypothetical protein
MIASMVTLVGVIDRKRLPVRRCSQGCGETWSFKRRLLVSLRDRSRNDLGTLGSLLEIAR